MPFASTEITQDVLADEYALAVTPGDLTSPVGTERDGQLACFSFRDPAPAGQAGADSRDDSIDCDPETVG